MTMPGDIQYKVMMAQLALANEKYEENKIRRIEVAMRVANLNRDQRNAIEAVLEEDLDLSDPDS